MGLLDISNLDVEVADRTVCSGVTLSINAGEAHVLYGRNGSGKSSLLSAIMGIPPYRITGGTVSLHGEEISELPVDERARRGLGMAFQRPPALPGVTIETLGTVLAGRDEFARQAKRLSLAEMARRDVNAGFSGGELKRWEVLKTILQGPKVALFDEPESGVDLAYLSAIGTAIAELVSTPTPDGTPRSAIIITHTGLILQHLDAAIGHVMADGRISRTAPAEELFSTIARDGYDALTPA